MQDEGTRETERPELMSALEILKNSSTQDTTDSTYNSDTQKTPNLCEYTQITYIRIDTLCKWGRDAVIFPYLQVRPCFLQHITRP